MLPTVVPPPHRRQRRHPALHDARGRSTVMASASVASLASGSCRLKGPMRLHLSRQCRNLSADYRFRLSSLASSSRNRSRACFPAYSAAACD
jgi:hypothetical protein